MAERAHRHPAPKPPRREVSSSQGQLVEDGGFLVYEGALFEPGADPRSAVADLRHDALARVLGPRLRNRGDLRG